MVALFVNPRLDYLCHAYTECPGCGDVEQQQLATSWTDPASWRCRMCKLEYQWQPEGTPTLAEAERSIHLTKDVAASMQAAYAAERRAHTDAWRTERIEDFCTRKEVDPENGRSLLPQTAWPELR